MKMTIKVVRKSSTQEWVVRSRNEQGELLGEYFTDDKADANGTAEHIETAYRDRGFSTELKLA